MFGGGQPVQSFAFTYFCDHIFDSFKHLVTDNLDWWYNKGLLDESREAITNLMEEKIGHAIDRSAQTTFGFIDCNCLECPKVLHGPAMPGKKSTHLIILLTIYYTTIYYIYVLLSSIYILS